MVLTHVDDVCCTSYDSNLTLHFTLGSWLRVSSLGLQHRWAGDLWRCSLLLAKCYFLPAGVMPPTGIQATPSGARIIPWLLGVAPTGAWINPEGAFIAPLGLLAQPAGTFVAPVGKPSLLAVHIHNSG